MNGQPIFEIKNGWIIYGVIRMRLSTISTYAPVGEDGIEWSINGKISRLVPMTAPERNALIKALDAYFQNCAQ